MKRIAGKPGVVLCTLLCVACFAASALAEELIVYPAKGQSASKMEKDKSECRSWATKEMEQNPSPPPSAATESSGPKGKRLRGGGRGAAGGAAIGAIAGDAGKGAAIGAVAGGMRGGAEQRRERREEKQEASQAQAQKQAQHQNDFNRAYAACLEGRGYTVK